MPSKHLISLTEHGGEEPVLQYSPMCGVWALTTYDACDIRCSYCASYAQGASSPRVSAGGVQRILAEQLPLIPRDQAVCLGPIIDCYPHAEAEHEVTRAALEVLVADGRQLVIVTKGTIIERDLDLLAGYENVSVNVSLPSLDESVLENIEPQAPTGAQRFATIERLADAGVDVQLHAQPWIPGMSDGKQLVEAAAGRLKVWFAPLNVQNPVVARSRWGKRFSQREINEAYVAEMKRVGRHPNVRWARPLWIGDDLRAVSERTEPEDCALDRGALASGGSSVGGEAEQDLLATPPLRSTDTSDRAAIAARDVATTAQIIGALSPGQIASLGLAKLSPHLRVYEARYPARQVTTEGRNRQAELMTLIAAMREPDLEVMMLQSDGPVVSAHYRVIGEIEEPFGAFALGDLVTAEAFSTYRYDTYGLLIEQWIEANIRRVTAIGSTFAQDESLDRTPMSTS